MKRIILLRHGESKGNKRLVGGTKEDNYINDCEIELTDFGKSQARKITDLLLERFGEFDKEKTELWVSPFKRTRQTAEIVNQKLNLRKVFEDPRISEHDYGNFDFQFMDKWKEIDEHSYFVDMMRYNSRSARFYARIDGGESFADVYNRVSLFDISRIVPSNNTQILVTHGDFILVALMYFTGAPIEFVYDYKEGVPNCSAFVLEKEEWRGVYEIKERITLQNIKME